MSFPYPDTWETQSQQAGSEANEGAKLHSDPFLVSLTGKSALPTIMLSVDQWGTKEIFCAF